MDSQTTEITYRFGDFLLDVDSRALFRLEAAGPPKAVRLGSRAWDILRVLVERDGRFVSKQEMMDTVWPNVTVEENNLTVQMAALRRVLDVGRSERSCIQTVAGRGYRLLLPVTPSTDMASANAKAAVLPPEDLPVPADDDAEKRSDPEPFEQPAVGRRRVKSAIWAAALCFSVAALLVTTIWYKIQFPVAAAGPPRLSVVVLPFQNLGDNPAENYLAEGLTHDLTSDLAHLPGAFVIANSSVRGYGRDPVDVRQVGREFGVRYVVEGSVQRIGDILRVGVELVSTTGGEQLWTGRFDEPLTELANGQEQILGQMRDALGISLVDLEAARGLHEHPTRPDAFDLLMRGRSLRLQPYSKQRREQALALFERALALDPNSVDALSSVALSLLGDKMDYGYWSSIETRDRVETLMTRAQAIDPDSESVHALSGWWQLTEGRCADTLTTVKQLTKMFPNNRAFYFILAQCRAQTGSAEEAIDLLGKARRVNPRDPLIYLNYELVGRYAMLLGRDKDAMEWTERSLAIDPDARSVHRSYAYRVLAAVYARSGQDAEAHHAAAAADQLWPFDTVRAHSAPPGSDPVFAEQLRQYRDALRLSGERDHADEDADFGVRADTVLHTTLDDYTPISAPGAMTIRTVDLVKLIDTGKPLVLDAMRHFSVRSLPGAIGLRHAGSGGNFGDSGQDRLRRKVRQLTGGDLSRPIVAVGWNSEHFDGRNLALRLVALGYTNVFWYRGGRETWEANGLPETDLAATDW